MGQERYWKKNKLESMVRYFVSAGMGEEDDAYFGILAALLSARDTDSTSSQHGPDDHLLPS